MEKYIQILKRVWLGFLLIAILMTVLITLLGYFFLKDAVSVGPKSAMFKVITLLLFMIIIFIRTRMQRKRKVADLIIEPLPDKLELYKSIYQTSLFCYTMILLFPIGLILYTNNMSAIIFCVLVLLLIILNKPSANKLIMELELEDYHLEDFKHLKFETKR